jgi:AAA family ATP:ADP antiporter
LKSIEKDEFLPLGFLFIHSFLNGIALTFFETTANTLFLMHYNTSELPYVYILTALVSVIAGFYYSKLEEKLSIEKLLKITMLFVLSIVVFFLLFINFSDSKLAYMGIMVMKDMIWMFAGMEFGILSGLMFNIRQGKRLFGLLMSGEILAGIVGGLSVGFLLEYIETISLLFISSLTLIISFVLLLKILNKFSETFKADALNKEASKEKDSSAFSLFKNRYYVLFFTISMLAFFIFYFIDYVFYFKVQERFSDEKELASFFGMFFALLNVVNLFSSLFVSGAMLSRFGVTFGLLVIPVLVLGGTLSLLVTALFSVGVGFIILIAVKLLNEVLDISILSPTFKLLNKSIPRSQRVKALAFRETVIEPTTMGAAGVLLLGASFFEGLDIVYYFIIVMAIAWLVLAKYLKNEYVKSLEKLLIQREVFSDDLLLADIDENLFIKGLSSKNEIEVLYCLNSLVKIGHKDIENHLINLSTHSSHRVRLSVLKHIANLKSKYFISILEDRIESEDNPEVFNLLLQTYAQVATFESVEIVSRFVDNSNPLIQNGAIIGLIEHTGVDGIVVAGTALNKLFESDNKENKITALNILKNMKIPSFHKALQDSLESEDRDVKSVAITVVGNLKIEKFLPQIFLSLEHDEFKNTTVLALIKFGSSACDFVIEHFDKLNDLSSKLALIRVLTSMKTKESNAFILVKLDESLLHDTILEKLFEHNFSTKDMLFIKSLLIKNVKEILFNLTALESLNNTSYQNSKQVLKELTEKKVVNLFFILGFLYSKETLLQCKLNYKSRSKDKKAYAVEIIDNMISMDMKKIILPILDEVSLDKKILSYSGMFEQKKYVEEVFFQNLLNDDDTYPILKISLLYEIGQNKQRKYFNEVRGLTKHHNSVVSETALWTLSQFNQR